MVDVERLQNAVAAFPASTAGNVAHLGLNAANTRATDAHFPAAVSPTPARRSDPQLAVATRVVAAAKIDARGGVGRASEQKRTAAFILHARGPKHSPAIGLRVNRLAYIVSEFIPSLFGVR